MPRAPVRVAYAQIYAPKDRSVPFGFTRLILQRRRARTLAAFAMFAVCCFHMHAQSAEAVRAQPLDASATVRRATAFVRGRSVSPAMPAAQGAPALAAARVQQLDLSASPQATSLSVPWTAVGPLQVQTPAYGLVTGRVTAVAIDPSDTTGNTVYLGTSGGGVWKSTNAAKPSSTVLFQPLTDTLPVYSPSAGTSVIPSLSIGAVSVQPGGTGVVLAGTGDPNDAADSYYGSGILRSADNGVTWSLVQNGSSPTGGVYSFVGQGIAGFAWSTLSPQLVVAAVSSSVESAVVGDDQFPGVRGLYYSTDGGVTWNIATMQDGSSIVQNRFTSYINFRGNAATSVVWNPVRKRFYAAVRFHGYYESADGMTWTRQANQPGSGLTTTNCPTRPGDYGAQNCPLFRGALAVQPTSGDLFALTVDTHNADQGLWQDACAFSGAACASPTVAWGSKLDTTPMEVAGAIGHGDYNLALAAVPAATLLSVNDTLLFAGAGDLYRCSLAGGCTLRNTTNATTGCGMPAGVAPAQHAIAWQANLSNAATPLLYFGNDGGLWRSTDGVQQTGTACSADDASHFDNLNGALGSLAEVSSLSSHPADPNTLLAALGANGSAASTTSAQATNLAPWTQLSAGESGTVAIDQGNGSVWLAQSGAGVALHSCPNGAACTAADFAGPAAVSSAQTAGDMALVDPPALLDPVLNSNVIAGTCRVWRGPTTDGAAWSVSNAVSPFLAGPVEPACNSSDASIRSLAAGGAVALTGAAQTSGSPILYAGLSGGADGGSTFGGHIFVTTGANLPAAVWADRTISAVTNDQASFNPGQFDVSSISVDPNDATGQTVYATILGFGYPHVYRSANAGATWTNISANLPNAPANALAVDPNNASIVYVAMDTGVYVTTDVSSCIDPSGGTVNCWSVMGSALPNAPVLSLVASRGITAPGASAVGVLRAGTLGRGIWQQPLLSAGTASVPVASFSPGSLNFSTAQQVDTTSPPQMLTLTNTGNAALIISTVAVSAGFVETDTCAGITLAVNAACTLQVYFAPVAQGVDTGTVQVFANVAGGYASVVLAGTGVGVSSVALSPPSLAFASTAVHVTSASQGITVSNNGSAALALGARAITGDFALATNTCGSSLAAGAACTLAVSFTPTASGPRSGFLSLTDANATHTIALSGSGIAGVLSLSAKTVAFPDTDLNTTSTSIVTVSNTGTGTLNIASVAATGDFAATNGCNGTALAPGRSCTVSITFTPTATGTRTGTLTLVSDAGGATGAQTSVVLTGNGRGAFFVVLTPASVNFGNQLTGTTSAVTNITVSNTGKQSGAITSIAVSGDYVLKANTCGPSLASQVGCTVSIAFVPSAGGMRNGLLTVVDDAGTQTATLTGVGTAAATDTLSPLSLIFGTQQVNTASASQSVTLTNSGDTPLTLVASQILAGDFTTVNGCGPTLAAHSACSIRVTFVPGSVGTRTGTLQVSDVQHIQTVALSGTAIAGPGVSLTPSTLTFASTGVGAVTAGQTLTLTNNGGVPLQVSAITVTGDFAIPAGSGTCSNTSALVPGSSCTLQIVFAPTAAGARAGTVSIQSNAATQTTHLAGTGIDFSLSPNGPTSLTIASGANAVYPLLLRPAVNTNIPVTYTCAGTPINATCKIVSQYSDLSSIGTVTVTVLTGTSATTAKRIATMALLPMLLALSLQRRRRGILVALVACALLLGSVSCGVGRKSADSGDGSTTGTGGNSPTPSGTYAISVSATAAGITRSVPLTLVVQ